LRAFTYYGILSGLGFGIAEGISYQTGSYYQAAESSKDFVAYFFESVLRLTSLPLLHAAWTGTAAYLLWFAAKVRTARTGLVLAAIGLAALFHGVYDGLLAAKWGFAAMGFAVLSLVLIAIYIASARQLEDAFEIQEDGSSAADQSGAGPPSR
jgi:RsiW-degrading membrane proteinase PrsW (M82 family)